MTLPEVNIHTHRPTGCATELRVTGIHPWDANGRHAADLTTDGIQAIGEIGLDFVRGATHAEQVRVLREQLALAEEKKLPVVLHCVKAFEPLMQNLKKYRLQAVIFHGFIGSSEQAQKALKEGYYLSFGERTFTSPKTMEALRTTPLDRIFCETDESNLSIGEIYAKTAKVRNITIDELKTATWENYKRIFHNK